MTLASLQVFGNLAQEIEQTGGEAVRNTVDLAGTYGEEEIQLPTVDHIPGTRQLLPYCTDSEY